MSAEKMSSDEVPDKFIEWLLAMGYPQEKIPSLDKVAQKSRGQYYMVWRSLMEHVRPKGEIWNKRLQVFCDDIRLCKKKSIYNKRDSSVVVPQQLLLWRQQQEIHKKVADAENQVSQARQDLEQLMEKVTVRIKQRDASRAAAAGGQRRVWLLRRAAAERAQRRAALRDVSDIAGALCAPVSDHDLQGKVDKCLAALRRPSAPPAALSLLSNPAANSSVVSTGGDDIEEQLGALARGGGAALWARLCERRAPLHEQIACANAPQASARAAAPTRSSTQSVLAHTASLDCSLALQALKQRARSEQARTRIAAHVDDLNDYIAGAACELLVVRCERASAEARVRSLRALLDELATGGGVFASARERAEPVHDRQISAIDKVIESSRDELKRLIVALAATDRKIYSTKEALTAVFGSFNSDSPIDRYKGVQLNFPQEPFSAICEFYKREREVRKDKADLSMDFDTSDSLLNNTIDASNPKFTDELQFYLKKFDLEKNRKLILESGEKIWIFESLHASLHRFNSKLLTSNITSPLCPSMSIVGNLRRIIEDGHATETLEQAIKELECDRKPKFDLDVAEIKAQEEAEIDAKKKKIGENLISLQKSGKTLELSQRNLQLWKDDVVKECISTNRTVNGKTYKEYEALYIEQLSLNGDCTTYFNKK